MADTVKTQKEIKGQVPDLTGHAPCFIVLMWICAALVNIKSMFVDYDVDNAYAVATSVRHVLYGDRLFLQMWEPHQTSSFVADALSFVFLKMTGGNVSFLTLWLHAWGIILYGAVTLCLFLFLRDRTEKHIAHLICIIFFVMRPKQQVFPEFSNMMIAFSVLLFICLVRYLEDQKMTRVLILAAVFLSLEILSYPTAIITYIPVVIVLVANSEKKLKNFLVFSGTCLLCGSVYVLYFALSMGPSVFVSNLLNVFKGDSSHNFSRLELISSPYYYRELLIAMGMVLFSAALSFVITRIMKRRHLFLALMTLIYAVTEILVSVVLYVKRIYGFATTYMCSVFYLLVIALGLRGIRSEKSSEKVMVIPGLLISASSVLAVMLLSNESLITFTGYWVLGATVSVIPYVKREKESGSRAAYLFLASLCLMFLAHRGFMVRDMAGPTNLLSVSSYYRFGPAKGIFCSYMPGYENRIKYDDWMSAVRPDDMVLIYAESYALDTSQYLYVGAGISHYSTICTSTYDERLYEYWEDFPEKFPTVIVLEEEPPEGSMMDRLVSEKFELYYEGEFCSFYRVKP
ncbi:MAG: hypothetical protein K5871_08015 [Lachnospiraceae bacterium]|nr:hypothetical protein [Lachnospiraceae bacterium]